MNRNQFTLLALLTLMPLAADAYVGPGAGLSLLGALWALVVAVGSAVVFVVAWPIRRLLRRRSEPDAEAADKVESVEQSAVEDVRQP